LHLLIVISVVGAASALTVAMLLLWALYVKPKLRRRYERNHHRAKTVRHRHADHHRPQSASESSDGSDTEKTV
jgi:hypothetical protein